MGFFSDIGHGLTGTKTDAENKSDRLNEERRVARAAAEASDVHARARAQFGDGALNVGTGGGIVTADGRAVTDDEYDAIYGTGSAATFKTTAAAMPNTVPTAGANPSIAAGQQLLADQTTATRPQTSEERLAAAQGLLAPFQGTGALTAGAPVATGTSGASALAGGVQATGASTAAPVAPTAPTLDRAGINKNLGALNTYQNALFEMSQDNTGLSAAEAQLKKATDLANMQAGVATQDSQRSALGMARSARNRGDRALLERQAVGEAGYIGQKAASDASLRRASAEGDLAILRATEEDSDRKFKLEAIKEAASLGLNTSALEVDISKANLDSANNWINNEFARANLGMQLDQQKTEAVMGFTRDMAALQFQYDQMSVQDQQETDKLMMQKYGIDQTTMIALKQIKASKEFDWNGLLTTIIGGAGSGATAAIAKSDERAKTSIETVDSTAAEFDEFMGALGAYSYEYKEPEKDGVGFMAQELEKTKLGRHMVKPDREGYKTVEIAPLALATASSLALVSERLKALEGAVK